MNACVAEFKPGALLIHDGGERFVVTENQSPVQGLEWLDGPEVIYATNWVGTRLPVFRDTVKLIPTTPQTV